ncbi:MAG: hypothetical protein ACXW2E_12845 [Nitrososphaeraceae archaeon]
MSEDDIFELTKFDKWQCEICGVKVKAELRGYDQKQKLKLMRNHLQLHTFPFRDPKDESINDYWCFSGEKIQEPQTNVR